MSSRELLRTPGGSGQELGYLSWSGALSFDSGTLSLYLALNRAVERNGGCRGPYALFGKGFRAPPLRALSPMLTETGKEGQAPLTGFGAALFHRRA
ncbi:hypothetical protein Nepgr_000517 [Nepenthes gracilis]|uniref:Uncharacterized protein n=1 Tax=Nepenthes gracilis TaxID=150966 RepID=A0AAD3P3L6_NEPGR|nr:hypothetical protein Nepgr_000517 [Nepenthes gracilis]